MHYSIIQKTSSIMAAVLLLINVQLTAQSVGINYNGATPNAAAALDIDVSAAVGIKKGLLPPRVSQSQRNAMNPLPAPAPGLLVYQTDGTPGFYYNSSPTEIPIWNTFLNSQSLRWDLLQSATGNLFLSNAANTTSFTFNGVTTGNAFGISSNTLSSGNLLNLTSLSNDGTGGDDSRLLNITKTGANTNGGHTSVGVRTSISVSGSSSTNYAGYFSATGGTNNYSLYVPPNGGRVSLGSDITSPTAMLTINDGHFASRQTLLPTIEVNVNAGILSEASMEIGSSDVAGTFTITSGGGAFVAGAQATVSFNKSFSRKAKVVISAASLNAASRQFYVVSNQSSFTIYFLVAPIAATSYSYNYIVIDN